MNIDHFTTVHLKAVILCVKKASIKSFNDTSYTPQEKKEDEKKREKVGASKFSYAF